MQSVGVKDRVTDARKVPVTSFDPVTRSLFRYWELNSLNLSCPKIHERENLHSLTDVYDGVESGLGADPSKKMELALLQAVGRHC